MILSRARAREVGLARIKRLANSGLQVEPLVRSIWDIMSEALPHSPHMAFLPDPGERNSAYMVSTDDAYRLLPAVQRYFVESAPEVSGYKIPYNRETLTRVFPRKRIWTLQDLAVPNFYRSQGYNEVFGKLGWYDGAQVSLHEDGVAVGHYPIWHSRTQRRFDRDDFNFLEAVAPPITNALKIAQQITASSHQPADGFVPSELWGQATILLDRSGRLLALDQRAQAIFEQLSKFDGARVDTFADGPVSDGIAYLVRIVNRMFEWSDAAAAVLPTPVVRFYSHWTGTVLRLRGVLLAGTDGREYINVLVERGESRDSRRRRLMYRWGLTEREAEVLELVAQGKTNPEIAIILELSALTVKKHLEHIFQALGVETRTAAAAVVLESKSG